MKTIVLASHKGGVGKSTLAVNLFIDANQRGLRVALWDADTQGSATFWAAQRKSIHGQSVQIFDRRPTGDYDLLIVDTAPHADAALPGIVEGASLVLIPMKPSGFDLHSAAQTIDTMKRLGIRHAGVMVMPTPRMPEIIEANTWLKSKNVELAGLIHHRVDMTRAASQGLALVELNPKSPGCDEIARVAKFVHSII